MSGRRPRATCPRWASGAIAMLAVVGGLSLARGPATADERCVVPAFQNALQPGGTEATMRVVNDGGGSCRIVNWVDARARLQPDSIRTVVRPQWGTVKIAQPGTIYYRPSPGFVGTDEFTYAGTGRTRDGRLVEMNVRVFVTVVAPPPLQADADNAPAQKRPAEKTP